MSGRVTPSSNLPNVPIALHTLPEPTTEDPVRRNDLPRIKLTRLELQWWLRWLGYPLEETAEAVTEIAIEEVDSCARGL